MKFCSPTACSERSRGSAVRFRHAGEFQCDEDILDNGIPREECTVLKYERYVVRAGPSTNLLPILTEPEVGESNPPMMFRSVLFPQPLGPRREIVPPRGYPARHYRESCNRLAARPGNACDTLSMEMRLAPVGTARPFALTAVGSSSDTSRSARASRQSNNRIVRSASGSH